MRISRHLSRLTARLYNCAARRGKRRLHFTGTTSCLLAIFISAGGHWAMLQSIAYTRMLLEFAEQDSLGTAVKKTFGERYACSLCPKIRDGFNNDHKKPLSLSEVQQPEFLAQSNPPIVFIPVVVAHVAFLPSRHIVFPNAPPKPPPRAA
jgi:hypothetical protein